MLIDTGSSNLAIAAKQFPGIVDFYSPERLEYLLFVKYM